MTIDKINNDKKIYNNIIHTTMQQFDSNLILNE